MPSGPRPLTGEFNTDPSLFEPLRSYIVSRSFGIWAVDVPPLGDRHHDESSPAAVGWPPTARAGATASRILTVIPFKLNYPILINIPILSFILRTLTGHSFETPK